MNSKDISKIADNVLNIDRVTLLDINGKSYGVPHRMVTGLIFNSQAEMAKVYDIIQKGIIIDPETGLPHPERCVLGLFNPKTSMGFITVTFTEANRKLCKDMCSALMKDDGFGRDTFLNHMGDMPSYQLIPVLTVDKPKVAIIGLGVGKRLPTRLCDYVNLAEQVGYSGYDDRNWVDGYRAVRGATDNTSWKVSKTRFKKKGKK